MYPMVAAALTDAAAFAGSSAAADIPSGNPSDAPMPHSATPMRATGSEGARMNTTSPVPARDGQDPQRPHAAEPVDERPPQSADERHRDREDGQGDGALRLGATVSVHHGEWQPVIRTALGERHAEHDRADRIGARIAPHRRGGDEALATGPGPSGPVSSFASRTRDNATATAPPATTTRR